MKTHLLSSVVLLMLLIFLSGCGYTPTEESRTTEIDVENLPSIETPAVEIDITDTPVAEGLQKVTVVRVIDGDTLVIDGGQNVRLIGVNTPEVGESGSTEATEFVSSKVLNQVVWLESDGDDLDRFDRLRRYVWLVQPTDARDSEQIIKHQLNALLLKNNLAEVAIFGSPINEALFRGLAR